MCGATRKLQDIPITSLRGSCFLMVWIVHVSCNLPCETHRVAIRVTAMQGTHLDKHLTMPYRKNIMKQFFFWTQWINMSSL